MFQRILVPVDGSETSAAALSAAVQLALEGGGRLRLVHAFDEFEHLTGFEYGADVLDRARASARKMALDAGLAVAAAAGVPADCRLLDTPGRRLGELVAEAARAFEADLIVLGTHGRRGMARALLGSGAAEVIRMAPVPVLAVRLPEAPEPD